MTAATFLANLQIRFFLTQIHHQHGINTVNYLVLALGAQERISIDPDAVIVTPVNRAEFLAPNLISAQSALNAY